MPTPALVETELFDECDESAWVVEIVVMLNAITKALAKIFVHSFFMQITFLSKN